MRILAAALLSLLPAAAGAVSVQTPDSHRPHAKKGVWLSSPDCPRTTSYYAYTPGEPIEPRKLAELPPANMYAAVLRHDGRCEIPVIVKYGVGRR